jgi:rubrerythrin
VLEKDLTNVIQLIRLMIEAELAASEFYENCAAIYVHDSDFWMGLSKDEALHAEVLTKLSKMIQRKPHEFEPGKLLSSAALKTFTSRIRSDCEKLMSGTLNMQNTLMTAYHIETTAIEAGYTEIIKTENPKYIEALAKLSAAEVKHGRKIKSKIDENRKKGILVRSGKTNIVD